MSANSRLLQPEWDNQETFAGDHKHDKQKIGINRNV